MNGKRMERALNWAMAALILTSAGIGVAVGMGPR